MFPDGWPGLGLLLLRAATGAELAWCSYAYLPSWKDSKVWVIVVATFAIASAISLLLGYLTPLASVLTALTSLCIMLAWLPVPTSDGSEVRLSSGFAVILAIALLCLGPGAFSLDARRYGRREIIIPQRASPSSEER